MRTAIVLFAIGMVVGPWVWAFLAVDANPSRADAQGAFSLATYLSMVTIPLGLVALSYVASDVRRERESRRE
jgi:hypothetical protein